MTVTALVLQSWFDLAVQHTGSASNGYAIAFANGGRSVTDDPEPGEPITIPATVLNFKKEIQYLENKKAKPATGFIVNEGDSMIPELGIGSMAIGTTFIVR